MSLLANSNAIESGGYNIDRSLRFRSSASAYLSRTPASAGNRKTWTWSGWVKRGLLGSPQRMLFASAVGTNDSNHMWIGFADNSGGDELNVQVWNGSLLQLPMRFRDPASWYHIVLQFDTTQATQSNRIKVYVNGQLQTPTINQAAINTDYGINSAQAHGIGYNNYLSGSGFFDGYLAEVNFIDGQALTPSSFGQTDAVTGVWTPKKYTGTYGTNGFYLPFSDNTSATTLAYDKSGNSNNWTANNISTTAGATYDSMTDVPTLTSATAANFCVWNPVSKTASTPTIYDGNLNVSTPASGCGNTYATMQIPSAGKWYWEVLYSSGSNPMIGIAPYSVTANSEAVTGALFYYRDGRKFISGTGTAYGATYTTGDVIGIAADADSGSVTFYKNGTSQGATSISLADTFPSVCDADPTSTGATLFANFGQRPFSYTPPTGFKALNTFNLPDPTIKKPNQYMDATTYTGNGSSLTVTNSGSFQPDLVWTKSRSNAYSNCLIDSSRGVSNALISNSTNAEDNSSGYYVTAFNSNGFSVGLGTGSNGNAATYVGWQWKKGATPGFDIVTYTGTAVNGQTFSHSLGVAPSMMIVKGRSAGTAGGPWYVYHKSLGATNLLRLNATNAAAADNVFNYTAPTSTVFTLGAPAGYSNASGETYVNYLFAEIPGFSKFGSYTGNGSADGPFVYCGFRPKYVLIKRSDSTSNWSVWDTSRNPYNSAENVLAPNLSDAEQASAAPFDIVSNGFKIRNTGNSYGNTNGGTYIYAAFAENPFKYSLAR